MDCIWNSLESIHLQTERPAKCWNSCGDRLESWRPCKKIYEKFTFFCVGPRAYYLCEPFRLKFTFHIIKRFTKNLPSLNIDRNMPYCEQKSSITFYSNAFAFDLRKKKVFFCICLCSAQQNKTIQMLIVIIWFSFQLTISVLYFIQYPFEISTEFWSKTKSVETTMRAPSSVSRWQFMAIYLPSKLQSKL